nr:hypothetical protein [Bacteroidota bacterium]
MKKFLIITQILLFSVAIGFAQISYEGKLDANMNIFQLKDGTLKFYKVDPEKKKLLVFNADNSLWRSIDLLIPKGHFIDGIAIINTASIENENQLYIVFRCYPQRIYPTEEISDFFSKQIFTVNVIDENGNFLLKIPQTNEYRLLSVNGNNKLLVYKTENMGFKSKSHIEIYGFDNY